VVSARDLHFLAFLHSLGSRNQRLFCNNSLTRPVHSNLKPMIKPLKKHSAVKCRGSNNRLMRVLPGKQPGLATPRRKKLQPDLYD